MEQSSERISAQKRALGLWARCWQLSGGEWPPASRAIAHQIVMMVTHCLVDVGNGRISQPDAFSMAHETLSPFLAQKLYSGSEQDFVIDSLRDVILAAEIGELE